MGEKEILELLKEVRHPAMQDRDIVDLGMVQSVSFENGKATVTLAFPKKRDPLTEYLVGAAKAALVRGGIKDYEVKAVVTGEAAPAKKTLDLDLSQLGGVKHVIGIASGKGGVGKSTVAVNLACALARLGYRVGLADADVYGPSVPTMTDTEGVTPSAVEEDGREYIIPIEKYGVKWMSIGYFSDRGQALI